MNDTQKQYTFKMDGRASERVERLRLVLNQDPVLGAIKASKAAVIRLALAKGLAALETECGLASEQQDQ